MKQLKIKKNFKKAPPQIPQHPKKPLSVKTSIKAGGFEWENLWSWVPGLNDGSGK